MRRVGEEIKNTLRRMARGDILFDVPLREYTSMGVGGPADIVVFPRDATEAMRIVEYLTLSGVPFLPVGNGTNLIVRDGGYRGVVLCLRGLQDLSWGQHTGGVVNVTAGAGLSLARLVAFTVDEGLTGLEFCAGIPGSVGGAVKMNAGAYGREMKDVVSALKILSAAGKEDRLGKGELSFAYRCLHLPTGSVILEAEFLLEEGERGKIGDAVAKVMDRRRHKHPLEYGSAGSIFKNPPGVPAGRLIEEAGLKGLTAGGAQISEKHGNFIVNRGGARASDVLVLIDAAREKVRAMTGIALETEVVIVGEDP